jgi:tetratricopeptide (TPR) repeat protein
MSESAKKKEQEESTRDLSWWLNLHLKGLEQQQSKPEPSMMVLLSYNDVIGRIFLFKGQYELGKSYMKESAKLCKKILEEQKSSQDLSWLQKGISVLKCAQMNWYIEEPCARELFDKAHKFLREGTKLGNPDEERRAWWNIGIVMIFMNNYQGAKDAFLKVKALREASNHPPEDPTDLLGKLLFAVDALIKNSVENIQESIIRLKIAGKVEGLDDVRLCRNPTTDVAVIEFLHREYIRLS